MLVEARSDVIATQEGAEATKPVKGRSLWQDAARRFVRNKAAVFFVGLLVLIVAFTIVGPYFAQYTIEKVDWNILGKVPQKGMPSIENGHFFGVDQTGRDLF